MEHTTRPPPDTCWDVALRCEHRLRRRFERAYGPSYVDDLWSEVVVERADAVFRCFDPRKGVPVDYHFMRSMLWYAYKWMRSRRLGGTRLKKDHLGSRARVVSLDEPVGEDATRADFVVDRARDGDIIDFEVDALGVDTLTEFERWLVSRRVVGEFTFEEIAEVTNVTPQTIGRWYREAIAKIREELDG